MSICSEHNKVNCGCQTYLTTQPPCPTPEDCPDAQPCSAVYDSECIRYTGTPITCNATIVVDTDDTVAEAVTNVVDYLCTRLEGIQPTGVKVYRAFISQTGVNDPVATVMQSDLSGPLVWTRNAAGDYYATLAGEFVGDTSKVFLMAMNQNATKQVFAYVNDANSIGFATSDGTDDNVQANVEIIIYP